MLDEEMLVPEASLSILTLREKSAFLKQLFFFSTVYSVPDCDAHVAKAA